VSPNHDPVEVELDLSNLTEADLEGDTPPPGRYHAQIQSIQRVSDKSSYLKIRLLLLAGTNPNGVGCVFSEKLFLTDAAKKRVACFAHRLRLIGENNFGGRVNVDWSKAVGRQLIVEVINEEYEGKHGKATSAKLSWAGFWSLDDERVASVPRDPTALQQQTATPTPAAAPANNEPPVENPWAGL
jgi:hypothetical protein